MKTLFTMASLLVLGACVTMPEVQFDYDYSTAFSSYRTFSWLDMAPAGNRAPI